MTVQIHNSRFEGIQAKAEKTISHLVGLVEQGYSLCSATSFGKDSSAVLVLFFEALRRAREADIEIAPCFVSHSDTLIENPAMASYAYDMIAAVEAYVDAHDLPVQMVLAEPSLSASFHYATIGRGKLPRFVDSRHRECSIDWKVKPQQRALKQIRKLTGEDRDLVVLVGTRESESAVRGARMESAGHTATALVTDDIAGNLYSNACIADWQMTDVWELLMACDANRGGVIQTYVQDFQQTLDLYRAGNEGACAIIVGDGGSKKSCGSRFGCGICTLSGDRDKSMESMIDSDPSQFSYMEGINRLRNFLVRTQYDFDRREWFQRGISEAGYVALSPDNYSSEMRRELFRYMVTLDVREQERAEDHAAALANGEIADTAENRRLCHPQFEWMTPRMIVAIDFAWSVYGQFRHAFSALREWYEIVHLGRRYDVPEIKAHAFPRQSLPEKRYFNLGSYEHPYKIDGLRNLYGEAVNPYRAPGRPAFAAYVDKETGETRRVAYFEEAGELDIDPVEANLFLMEFEDLYFDTLDLDAADGLRYMLDRRLVKIGRGQIATYDRIARRGQAWMRLQDELNVMDVQQYAIENTISTHEHDQLVNKARQAKVANAAQGDLDLFGEVA